MKKLYYEAFWHKNVNVNGHNESDIIDTTGIACFSKNKCIEQAKVEFKNLINNKTEYNKMCNDNNATSIDIVVECFSVGDVNDINDMYGVQGEWEDNVTTIK